MRSKPENNLLQVVFDPEAPDISYGHYRCQSCNSQFFGGGPALHKSDCPKRETGYDGLEYVIGPKAVSAIVNGTNRLNPIDIEDLKRCCPEVLIGS